MEDVQTTPSHTLYVDHHGWLLGWLRRRLGNIDCAADVAHDTFLRVLGRPNMEPLDEPRAYLTVIAKGLISNLHWRQTLERAYLESLAVLPERLEPSPEERVLLFETLCEVDRLLDALAPKVRDAFLLSQLEDMPYPEIAVHLNLSVRTVKRYMVTGFVQCLSILN